MRPAPAPPPGPTSRSRRSTSRRCGSRSARRSAGVLAAATQPLLPAHLLADVPFADLATSDFARLPVGSGPFAITDMDDQRATLVPASGVMPPVEDDPAASAGAAPSMRLARDAPPAAERRPARPVPRRDRGPLLRGRGRRSRRVFGPARWTRRRGCPRHASASSPRRSGIDRHAYPTTTLSTVLLNLRPAPQGAARPEGPDRAAGRHRPRRARRRRPRRQRDARGRARAADVLGVRRRLRPAPSSYDPQGGREGPAGRRLVEEGRQVGRARRQGAPTRSSSSPCAGAANPRLASVAAYVRDSWTTFGFDVSARRGASARTSRPGCAPATSRPPSWTSPRASSRTCTRCSRPPRSAPPGRTSPATRTPPLDPLLEAARKPGTPEERAAAWKALLAAPGDPAAAPAARLERRGDARPRPRRGHPAAHRGHRRPLLGCASMAPRRGPVSLRAGRFHGRAEVAEW